MQRKRIVIVIVVLLAAALTAVLLIIGSQSAGDESAVPTAPTDTEEKQQPDQQAAETEKEPFNQVQNEQMERIFGNTYIYYDEFLPGKPVTYTFYENGTMVAYYWEDTESESIPLSSQWARYSVNDNVSEINLDWDDGTKTTEPFKIKRRAIVIGETEFKLSDREIHLN